MPKANKTDLLSRKIAAKARDLWIKKAAAYHVEAEAAAERSDPSEGVIYTPPICTKQDVPKLLAQAEHAERMAREWGEKADTIYDDEPITA
jgi:hypothetical protein